MKVLDAFPCRQAAGASISSLSPPATIAAAYANEVDRAGRLPSEALAALRAEGLLGLLAPERFGGPGLSLRAVANVCRSLAEACAATGLIFAMHHSQAAVLINHAGTNEWHQYLIRRMVGDQLLIASATTEGATGGSIRSSVCYVDMRNDGGIRLSKQRTVISYANAADIFLVSARREADAAPSDQRLVAFRRDQARLTQQSLWNPMGMRGACTECYDLKAQGDAEQLFPGTFAHAMSATMLPTSHILLASVWLGIASSAMARAQGFLRARNRAGAAMNAVSNLRLAEGEALVQQMRGLISSNLAIYENGPPEDGSVDRMVSYNALKVSASEWVVRVTDIALRICGITGYMDDGDFYLSRHIRDAHSAMVMVNDDRILGNIATVALGLPLSREI